MWAEGAGTGGWNSLAGFDSSGTKKAGNLLTN